MSILHTLITPFLKLAFNFQSKRKLPQISGTLDIYGLKDPVTINRDKWGVPHIQAAHLEDLFFAQGFVHCQDRLWQMELNRRIATGTLSEIFGDLTVDTDRLSRTLGFQRLGEQDWELQSDGAKQAIQSYVQGINAYLNHLDTPTPLEFSLVKFTPEEWTREDTMAISHMMLWQLSHAWYGETIRSQMIDAVGDEHAAELEIQYTPDNPIQLPEGIEFNKLVKGSLKKASGPFLKNSQGSNGWVISAEKSATGSPILCNDMHLALTLPSIWYHNHLRSKDLNVTGVSIPGLPLVLVGHNDHIAWGATLSYNDCEDLFVEKLSEDDQQYEFKGKMQDLTVLPELIKVKDGLTVQQTVKITHHGPIISDFINTREEMALQSKSLQPVQSITGWYQLNFATGWDEFVASIKLIEAPSLNIVYADEKNIGYFNSGRVPVRAKGDGRLPAPGWTGKYEWKGEIPFEEMPHALNPSKGYLITCNNKVISDDYPHYLGENFMNGFRARRLEQYFAEHDKITMEMCQQMQLDYQSLAAPLFIEHYHDLTITDANPNVKRAFDKMMSWDGLVTPGSAAAAIYEVTRRIAIRTLLEKHLGEDLTDIFLGVGLHPILLPSHEFYAQDIVVLLRLLDAENSWWIEHAGGKEQFLITSFKRAFEWLMDHLGTDINKWQWGRFHRITFDHALSSQEPLNRVFSRGPYPVGGDSETPNQMAHTPENYGVTSWAPSWRQIVDLGDLTRSLWMYAPGQSGQLASAHYDDLIKSWLDGTYNSLLWTRGQIENNESGELKLQSKLQP